MTRIFQKIKLLFFIAVISNLSSCEKGNGGGNNNPFLKANIKTPSEEQGLLYVNGIFSGKSAPTNVIISPGTHVFSVALKQSGIYLRKSVEIKKENTITDVTFSLSDKQKPRTWNALWMGIKTVQASVEGQMKKSSFSTEELNAGFDFFEWSIQNHFMPYSYGTMKWEITRQDITTPVTLNKSGANYTIDFESGIQPKISDFSPGKYDCVFVMWRQKDGDVDFNGYYLGLAEIDPLSNSYKTGYVQVKFPPYSGDINNKINDYKNNDPGVWIHEWLHTVGERFYQRKKGTSLPLEGLGSDKLVIHSAEAFGYKYPWMDWYQDLIMGTVKNGTNYVGIGPEALVNSCTVRESAEGCDD